ncbi:MAG: leucyl/phenylalanyl-tRNA--protein transferase [Saprospiraceae bacterium]|nr:leucyl/phenylalanyl-tRNA--protein transferase [Saprospiraceae bacterium]
MHWLTKEISFPPPQTASEDGLLAIGGDLSIERILYAYNKGIFPWFNKDEPILWWCPDPRFILLPSEIKVSKSMRQVLKKNEFTVTFDKAFEKVILNCSIAPRKGQTGSWLTDEMIDSYIQLYQLGYAHSVESWKDGKLVGGLYGLSIGKCFFGESMFTKVSNASKTALIHLAKTLEKKDFSLIDCQSQTNHLASMGAKFIPRTDFLAILEANTNETIDLKHRENL